MLIKIADCLSGEIIEREMTEDELAQYNKDQKAGLDEIKSRKAKVEAKAALLEKLGITEEEAKLLLG